MGWPRDVAEWIALGFAALLIATLLIVRKSPLERVSASLFRAACAVSALLLSALYVVFYLRGGPRIVDASTYFLQGRALSEGHLTWSVGDVPSSTMGRFLVRDTLATTSGAGDHAAGIFPPGYPAILALGFLIKSPLAVGPLLAATLSLLVFDLADEVARSMIDLSDPERAMVPRVAALLTVICAALRYHTADTMSHGLAAVCLTAALVCAFRLVNKAASNESASKRWTALALGLAIGWLVITRPVSGIAGAFLVAAMMRRELLVVRTFALALLGAAGPMVFLVIQQHAVTGAWLTSSQSLYYAVSDGPGGCFAYGFGDRIGCRIEHADFVAHNLPGGYGWLSAIATTLRRLKMHLVDPLNAQVLFVIVLAAIGKALTIRSLRPLALSLPVFALAYAPFYFDGNYPGGGARFFSDQIPIELTLVAATLPFAARRLVKHGSRVLGQAGLGLALIAAACAGFAFFAGHEHALLRDREGGRPMFEPRALSAVGVASGLVFVDTDHGFDLGFDPDANPASQIRVARLRRDVTDFWLWEELGHPASHLYAYSFEPNAKERVAIVPYEPPSSDRLEAESLWPPLAQSGQWALPEWSSCASQGRWLRIVSDRGSSEKGVTLALPRRVNGLVLSPRIAVSSAIEMHLILRADGATVHEWSSTGSESSEKQACGSVTLIDLEPALAAPLAAHYTLEMVKNTPGKEPQSFENEMKEDSLAALDALRVEEIR